MSKQAIGNFIFSETYIEGVYVIEGKKYGDDRGYFMESYHYPSFCEAGISQKFVQDNQSKSRKGVLRGLHFQTKNVQGKLVRILKGEVFGVAVDLRGNSNTYGKWVGEILSSDNCKQLYIPEGFAHGFLVLSDEAEFAYKCTDIYNPEYEGGILWNDKSIGIEWPIDKTDSIILSDKDKSLKPLKDQQIEFL